MVEKDVEAAVPKRAPQADCFLLFCRFINVITGVSAILCFVAQAMALAVGPPLSDRVWFNVQVLRVYALFFASLVLLAETEWHTFLSYFKILENWVARGFLQSFLAVLTFQIATPHGDSDMDKSVVIYRNTAGYCMVGCAGFYVLGGMLCFSSLRDARHRREVERLRVERDLESLERQREELQTLLAAYTKH